MVDKKIIKARKSQYGDNFQSVADKWSDYLGGVVAPQDVALMLAKLKEARLEHQLKHASSNNKEEAQQLLDDTKKDLNNYYWIAHNYKEYKEM